MRGWWTVFISFSFSPPSDSYALPCLCLPIEANGISESLTGTSESNHDITHLLGKTKTPPQREDPFRGRGGGQSVLKHVEGEGAHAALRRGRVRIDSTWSYSRSVLNRDRAGTRRSSHRVEHRIFPPGRKRKFDVQLGTHRKGC